MLQDDAGSRNPVRLLAVNEMADDIEYRPGIRPLVRMRPARCVIRPKPATDSEAKPGEREHRSSVVFAPEPDARTTTRTASCDLRPAASYFRVPARCPSWRRVSHDSPAHRRLTLQDEAFDPAE